MEDVIHQIAEAEDSNYTLFTFVSELNRDIEKLQMRIGELKKDTDSGNENAAQPTAPLSTHEASLSSTSAERKTPETNRTTEAQETTAIVLARTQELIQTLPRQYLTDGGLPLDDITTENVERHLAGVERFVDDLLKVRRRTLSPFVIDALWFRRVIMVRVNKTRHGHRNIQRFRRRCPLRRRRRIRMTTMASKQLFWTPRHLPWGRHFVPMSPERHRQNPTRARVVSRHRESRVGDAFKT